MRLTTTNLQLPSVRAWWNLPTPIAATICIFALLMIAALIGRLQQAPIAAAVPTPALDPIIIIASPLPVVPPTAIPPAAQVAALTPNALRRAVVAYDAPAGNVLGAIEQGRVYSVLARWGSDWLQADVQDSGVVWLKADQVLDLPAGLADLEPTQAPVIVERPIYVAAQPAAIATPKPHYEVTSAAPTLVPQQAAIYDRQVWAMQQAAGR
jgi:hypothetical protein